MSATSRRKAGKWLAICTVDEEVLVEMRKGSLEVSRIFVGKAVKKCLHTGRQAIPQGLLWLFAFVSEVLLVHSHLLVMGCLYQHQS